MRGFVGFSQHFPALQAKERKEAEAILKDCNGQVDAAEAWRGNSRCGGSLGDPQNHRFEYRNSLILIDDKNMVPFLETS